MNTIMDSLRIARDATQIGANKLQTSQPEAVHHKCDRDPVTDIDLGIQHDIADYLHKTTPEIPLLAEESVEHPDINAANGFGSRPDRRNVELRPRVAPVSVSLALMYGGETVVAVTYAPLLHRTYHAVKDQGAFLNGHRIGVSRTSRLTEAIVSLGDYAVGHDAAALNEQRLALTAELVPRVERIRMVGAATLDLAFVAEGR